MDSKLGVELANIEKSPSDVSIFIKKNNIKKYIILIENLLKK